ncbi:MAG: transposase [Chloroflexi bacterium]|nr:transposase [Chloroflexota bacterium]
MISKTTLRQLSLVVLGMLMMTGRITMLGISCWTDKGGSYRTIQRLYHTKISWSDVLWTVFQKWLQTSYPSERCEPYQDFPPGRSSIMWTLILSPAKYWGCF